MRAAGMIAVVLLVAVGMLEFAVRFSSGAGVADAAYHAWVLAIGIGAVILAMLIERDTSARTGDRPPRVAPGRKIRSGR
jgi:hypothetical protein